MSVFCALVLFSVYFAEFTVKLHCYTFIRIITVKLSNDLLQRSLNRKLSLNFSSSAVMEDIFSGSRTYESNKLLVGEGQ